MKQCLWERLELSIRSRCFVFAMSVWKPLRRCSVHEEPRHHCEAWCYRPKEPLWFFSQCFSKQKNWQQLDYWFGCSNCIPYDLWIFRLCPRYVVAREIALFSFVRLFRVYFRLVQFALPFQRVLGQKNAFDSRPSLKHISIFRSVARLLCLILCTTRL